MEELFLSMFIVLTIGIILFLVFRQIILWYYRINEAIKNQETTNMLLSQILQKMSGDPVANNHPASQTGVFMVEHIESGQTKEMSEAEYQKLLSKPGNEGKFRVK